MKNTLLILSLAIIPFLIYGQTIISNDVESQFELQNEVDCIIQLTNQWSAPNYVSSWTKDEKSQFVFSSLYAFAQTEQKEVIKYLSAQNIQYKSFYVFNGFQAKLTSIQLSHLLNHFEIASVSYNKSTQQYFPRDENLSQRMPTEWGIQKIMADSVWNLGFEGAEVVVAGQDTGYDFDNPLINQKYRGFNNDTYDHQYNWHDAIHELNPLHDDPDDNPMNNPCGLDSPIPCDDNGHGTHTMGTMVGQDAENGIGVAPKASWISCRNMDRGWGKPSTYTECFEWFLAPTDLNNENPDPSKSPHVINNSWGCPEIEGCNSDNWIFMETVVNNLVDAGIVVVVSAGNDGNSGCNSINRPPSMFERTFAVGASAENDTIAGFSSYGPVTADGSNRWKPDVVAPGVGVRSITLDDFGTWSGTSMAGPHVAGAVALIISANPALAGQVDEIQTILKNTARHLTDTITCQGISADQVPNFRYGYGRINVFEAVKEALLTVNTEEVEEKGLFYLYPNPVENTLFLGKASVFESQSKISYEIYSNTGAKTLEGSIENRKINNIDVSALANGIYYLRCKTSNQTSVLTFVKQ